MPAPSEVPPPVPAPPTKPAPAPPTKPTPAPSAPADEVMPGGPAEPSQEVEDLFSEPATPPATEPAAPSSDVEDLFDTPSTPAESMPPAAPAEPSTPAEPSDVDDLFKTEPSDTSATSNDKATDGELEELFSQPEDEAPMSASADAADPLVAEAERLFAESTDEATPAAAGEAEEPSADRQVAEDDPAGAMRLWTDNTGKFQVRARLVNVGRTHVRLLKENGKFSTVPYNRLSRNDLAFVRQVDRAIVASF